MISITTQMASCVTYNFITIALRSIYFLRKLVITIIFADFAYSSYSH